MLRLDWPTAAVILGLAGLWVYHSHNQQQCSCHDCRHERQGRHQKHKKHGNHAVAHSDKGSGNGHAHDGELAYDKDSDSEEGARRSRSRSRTRSCSRSRSHAVSPSPSRSRSRSRSRDAPRTPRNSGNLGSSSISDLDKHTAYSDERKFDGHENNGHAHADDHGDHTPSTHRSSAAHSSAPSRVSTPAPPPPPNDKDSVASVSSGKSRTESVSLRVETRAASLSSSAVSTSGSASGPASRALSVSAPSVVTSERVERVEAGAESITLMTDASISSSSGQLRVAADHSADAPTRAPSASEDHASYHTSSSLPDLSSNSAADTLSDSAEATSTSPLTVPTPSSESPEPPTTRYGPTTSEATDLAATTMVLRALADVLDPTNTLPLSRAGDAAITIGAVLPSDIPATDGWDVTTSSYTGSTHWADYPDEPRLPPSSIPRKPREPISPAVGTGGSWSSRLGRPEGSVTSSSVGTDDHPQRSALDLPPHLASRHPSGTGALRCPQCPDRVFALPMHLAQHRRDSHGIERQSLSPALVYKCSHCTEDRSFPEAWYLVQHLRGKHRMHQCPFCGYDYTHGSDKDAKDHLSNAHSIEFTGLPITPTAPGKAPALTALPKEFADFPREMLNVCPLCDKPQKFGHIRLLAQHLRDAHDAYRCTFCPADPRTYTQAKHFAQHLRDKHNIKFRVDPKPDAAVPAALAPAPAPRSPAESSEGEYDCLYCGDGTSFLTPYALAHHTYKAHDIVINSHLRQERRKRKDKAPAASRSKATGMAPEGWELVVNATMNPVSPAPTLPDIHNLSDSDSDADSDSSDDTVHRRRMRALGKLAQNRSFAAALKEDKMDKAGWPALPKAGKVVAVAGGSGKSKESVEAAEKSAETASVEKIVEPTNLQLINIQPINAEDATVEAANIEIDNADSANAETSATATGEPVASTSPLGPSSEEEPFTSEIEQQSSEESSTSKSDHSSDSSDSPDSSDGSDTAATSTEESSPGVEAPVRSPSALEPALEIVSANVTESEAAAFTIVEAPQPSIETPAKDTSIDDDPFAFTPTPHKFTWSRLDEPPRVPGAAATSPSKMAATRSPPPSPPRPSIAPWSPVRPAQAPVPWSPAAPAQASAPWSPQPPRNDTPWSPQPVRNDAPWSPQAARDAPWSPQTNEARLAPHGPPGWSSTTTAAKVDACNAELQARFARAGHSQFTQSPSAPWSPPERRASDIVASTTTDLDLCLHRTLSASSISSNTSSIWGPPDNAKYGDFTGTVVIPPLPATGPVKNPGALPGWENWPTRPDSETNHPPRFMQTKNTEEEARIDDDWGPDEDDWGPDHQAQPSTSAAVLYDSNLSRPSPYPSSVLALAPPQRPWSTAPAPATKAAELKPQYDTWLSLEEAGGGRAEQPLEPLRPVSAASASNSTSTSSTAPVAGKKKRTRIKKGRQENGYAAVAAHPAHATHVGFNGHAGYGGNFHAHAGSSSSSTAGSFASATYATKTKGRTNAWTAPTPAPAPAPPAPAAVAATDEEDPYGGW